MKTELKYFYLFIVISVSIAFSSCQKEMCIRPAENTPVIERDINIPMDFDNWVLYGENDNAFLDPAPNVFERIGDNLKFWGQAYRRGSRLSTRKTFYLKDNTLFMKWKANTANKFSDLHVTLYYSLDAPGAAVTERLDLTNFSGVVTYLGSEIIQPDTWYYTRVKFADSSFVSVTALGDYDSNGGTVAGTTSKSGFALSGWISFLSSDAYAGSASYCVVAECKVKSN